MNPGSVAKSFSGPDDAALLRTPVDDPRLMNAVHLLATLRDGVPLAATVHEVMKPAGSWVATVSDRPISAGSPETLTCRGVRANDQRRYRLEHLLNAGAKGSVILDGILIWLARSLSKFQCPLKHPD